MTLSELSVEMLAQWCGGSEKLADIGAKSRSEFSGYDNQGLEDGKHQAETAKAALSMGDELENRIKFSQVL